MIEVLAPAKINLNLHVLGNRPDGYHDLSSLIIFTKWGDVLSIKESEKLSISASGPYKYVFEGDMLSVDQDSPNLIIRAVHLMGEIAGREPKFDIHLIKNIPTGAGLGGGSSDAAAMMNFLNTFWQINMEGDELASLGLRLGAELPVCLKRRPSLISGIGDQIQDGDVPQLNLLIVWPDDGLFTKDVFALHRKREQEKRDVMPYENKNFIEWLQTSRNDLTPTASELCPQIPAILNDIEKSEGCIVSRMSGSGSACFGVFEEQEQAEQARQHFKNAIVTRLI